MTTVKRFKLAYNRLRDFGNNSRGLTGPNSGFLDWLQTTG